MDSSIGPDYVFWSKLDAWSHRDAALLLCGLDPDRVRGSGIRLDGRELPPEFIEAAKIYRILKSATDAGPHGVHPFTVIEHALGKGLPLPGPLLEAVRERFRLERKRAGRDLEDTLGEADEAAPHPRSKQFLLRLIYVLATQGYGLKLDMPYNDASDIADDAERLGLALDRGTIANYLSEARQQAEVLGLVA
ncbi:MAG: hypothetical protein H6935_15275 [Thiobacillus sp.]|nr:hypothetical protein [Thiobacillus sp.]